MVNNWLIPLRRGVVPCRTKTRQSELGAHRASLPCESLPPWTMIVRSTIVAGAILAAHSIAAQEHRFEDDPVATVHENFVACEVLSQLQPVIEQSPLLARWRMCPVAGRRTGPCLR